MSNLQDIKVGDRVWVSAPYTGERGNLHTIKHLTPTQVHLDGYRMKFKRGTPSKWSGTPDWSGIGFTRGTILSVATADEVAAWDGNLAAQAAALKARKQAAQDIEQRLAELSDLFGKRDGNYGIYVTSASFGNSEFRKDKYDVTIHSLSEIEVRRLAEKMRT